MKNSNKPNRNKPFRRVTETETTVIERTSTPKSGRTSKMQSANRSKKNGSDNNANTGRKAWEIRPHETSYALPAPGKAVNTNDEAWYIGKLQDQADRFASVPWTAIAGDSLTADACAMQYINGEGVAVDVTLTDTSRVFPSIMAAGLIPALGNTTIDPTRLDMPWMTTAEQKLAYLQSKISGSLPFAAADLVCYWFCAADVFAEIAQAERALKIARTWKTFENISYPRQLCAALGWNFDAIMGNILIFEGKIQEIINLANTLLLPKDLKLVERWYFLYSHVFKDSNLPTAKLYGYRKDGYYTFEEALVETGTACQFHASPCWIFNGSSTLWTPDTWFATMFTNINKLLPGRSTTIVDIMSKLLRAYDVATFFAYPAVSKEGIDAKFDPEALTAFANLTLTSIPDAARRANDLERLDFIQHPTYLTLSYRGMLWSAGVTIPNRLLLRSWEAKPSVGSLLEMTRLTACADMFNANPYNREAAEELIRSRNPQREDETDEDYADRVRAVLVSYWLYTGTEMVTTVDVYNGSGDTSVAPTFSTFVPNILYSTAQSAVASFDNALLWLRFEYAPILYTGYLDGSGIPERQSLLADLDNYTTVAAEVLGRIHRLAIANLWGVQTDFIG